MGEWQPGLSYSRGTYDVWVDCTYLTILTGWSFVGMRGLELVHSLRASHLRFVNLDCMSRAEVKGDSKV